MVRQLSDGSGGAASGEIAGSCFIDTARVILKHQDQNTFLLCSDGLTDAVKDEKINIILSSRITTDLTTVSLVKIRTFCGK
jgi:serine/threonine protein phosphatase PrpC